MRICEIYNYLDKIAPFNTQSSSDNSGLLIGDTDREIKKISVCLDATNAVIEQAIKDKVELIISHHPLMYRPIRRVADNDPVCRLIRGNIALIAAHTNLDTAIGGITEQMLVKLGLPPSDNDIDYFGRIAELDESVSADELAKKCKTAFDYTVVRYVDGGRPIKRLAVCSGSGGDLLDTVIEKGCDGFICGDLRHNHMVQASNCRLTLIDAGHFHTENIFCDDMVQQLQQQFGDKIIVEKSVKSVDEVKYCL
jgi:dinuclear metal center YbgI/SA1388 family protein